MANDPASKASPSERMEATSTPCNTITYQGFKSGYFNHPEMKLVNVLTFGKDTLISESLTNLMPHQESRNPWDPVIRG